MINKPVPTMDRSTPNLATRYLGLELRNPIVVSACPLTAEIDVLKRLEAIGVAAAVMPSLFAEQFQAFETAPRPTMRETAQRYQFFHLNAYNGGPKSYLDYISRAKQVIAVPIFGSLNVIREDGWLAYARRIEEAGADALELNTHFLTTDPDESALDVETRLVDLVAAVRSRVRIPLSIKIGSQFTALPHFARRLVVAGADGLSLFNRNPPADLDLNSLEWKPELMLSTPLELRVALHWLAILRSELACSLAATGGVETAEDLLKAIVVGADAVLVASTLYRHGIEQVGKLLGDVSAWLSSRGYTSIREIHGMLCQKDCVDAAMFERANYTKAVSSYID